MRRLDYAVHAETIATFKKRLVEWLPFFPDAAKQIDAMRTWEDYTEFRRGLQSERDKIFAGGEWVQRYGAILMPGNAIRASLLADHFQAPWGAALVRVVESERDAGRTLSVQRPSVEERP